MADSSEDSEESSSSSSSESLPLASSSRPASRRRGRILNSARPEKPSEAHGAPSAESSAKSGGQPKLPMPKLDLKALFDYHSRMKQQKKKRRKPSWTEGSETEEAAKYKIQQPRAKRPRRRASDEKPKRPRRRASDEKRKRALRKRCFQFPFVQKLYGKKHIPFRMEYLFEQEALQGFFKYIERLKFEHCLQKSLAKLDATDDLEKESLESRRHKYLDDDGPLSPIAEANGEDTNEGCDTEDIGARVVENSCFILSEIPKQMKSKRKTKS